LAGALLAAVARPFDPVPTLAVLRSALCGVTDADLLAWRRAGGRLDVRVDPRTDGPVAEGLRCLRGRRARVRGRPRHEGWPPLLRRGGRLRCEGAGFEGAQRSAILGRPLQQLLRAAPVVLAGAAALVEQGTLRETADEESPLFEDGA